ncbi:MAG: NUDIX domain-containing protein [Gammaproteobacteria bacterium]|nr:NUDIX domain-containing protein [Pseudomonadales bacterium]MCP5347888.1 NUDIX domain-containing protein [Pseudomonadales bacterium]
MKTLKILFVCTGNSCRSQMAEGWCRHLAGRLPPFLAIEASSAGLEAHGLNPLAVAAMAERGVDISNQVSTVLTDELIAAADLIITVCSHADSHCPVLPAGKRKLHLPFADPASASGDQIQVKAVFTRVCEEIRQAVAGLFQELILQRLAEQEGDVYSHADVRIENRERVYDGFVPIDVLQLRHRLFAGGWSESMRRELALRPAAVGVLLYDPDRDDLVMVKQFRTGAIDAEHSPWMLEIVAGLADPGEAPIEVVKREAREEANCEVSEAVPICDYLNSPGWCDEKVSLFCALVDAGSLQGIHGLDDEHEDILIVTVPLEKAIAMISGGEINNAMSIIAIQWLQLNRSRFQR